MPRDQAREFARTVIARHSDWMDRNARLAPEVRAGLFETGLLDYRPERGLGEAVAAIEEIAKVDPGTAVVVDVHTILASRTVHRWATPEARAEVLPGLATGRLGAFALSEEHAGSDAFALRTQAKPVGDGYVLTGHKKWTSLATQAEVFVLFAQLVDGGVTAFLVDREADGLIVGEPTDQAGVRAACTAQLHLDNVHVPARRLLGTPGGGAQVAMDALTVGRVGIAAQLVGLADGALQAAVEYAGRREQFGRKLAAFQGIQLSLGEMATDVAAARALLNWAVDVVDRQRVPVARLRAAAMAKQFAARVAQSVATAAVEVHGGAGYERGTLVERFYRDAKVGSIYEGTSTILLRTIASTLLGADDA